MSWTIPAWPAPAPTPLDLTPGWIALRQPWQGPTPPPAEAPGAANLCWDARGLRCDFLFHGPHQGNRATRLNERTWETGDVGELFLQIPGCDDYFEIHLTPENQRLQLHWTADGLRRVRQKQACLDNFLVADIEWVQSHTRRHANWWSGNLHLPAARLGYPTLSAGLSFRLALCRYHYRSAGAAPDLSTTARLPSPNFHQPACWDEVVLQPPPADPRETA